MINFKKLKSKGWTNEEIEKAKKILSKERHTFITDRIAKYIYWFALLLIIIGNFFVSVIIIPFVLFLPKIYLVLFVTLVAIAFGALFNILLKDVEMTDPKHRIMLNLFLPVFLLIIIYVIVDVAKGFIEHLNIQNYNPPLLISTIYVLGFIVPILFSNFVEHKSSSKHL